MDFDGIKSFINLGDTLWAIAKDAVNEKKPCEFCGGMKQIKGQNLSVIDCPPCGGTGEIEYDVIMEWQVFRRFQVDEIMIILKEDGSSVMCKHGDYTFPQANCFLTKKEAQDTCDALNSAHRN